MRGYQALKNYIIKNGVIRNSVPDVMINTKQS